MVMGEMLFFRKPCPSSPSAQHVTCQFKKKSCPHVDSRGPGLYGYHTMI